MIPKPPPSAGFEPYLDPTPFLDFDEARVRAFVLDAASAAASPKGRAVALFYAVRDGFRYDPYRIDLRPEGMTASAVLERGYGFCVTKAVLLAASGRALGIPTRLGFADVLNHLSTERLRREMQTDLFVYHGYAELYLDGRWVKATPAFNASLCERFDAAPLEWDGETDALLQPCDRRGNRYMEYVRDRGTAADLPLDDLIAAWREAYPRLMDGSGYRLPGRFEDEAGG